MIKTTIVADIMNDERERSVRFMIDIPIEDIPEEDLVELNQLMQRVDKRVLAFVLNLIGKIHLNELKGESDLYRQAVSILKESRYGKS